jgi:hypothetical protein
LFIGYCQIHSTYTIHVYICAFLSPFLLPIRQYIHTPRFLATRRNTKSHQQTIGTTWRVPGSELWIGVKWYVQYKRRYQQIVCLWDDSTIYNCSQWYYLSPHWLKSGGCKCPCFPKNAETYFSDTEFEDEAWSSSDEEGTIEAYDCKNMHLFYAYAKTGKKLKEGEMVVPYVGPIPMEQPYEDVVTGWVLVSLDKIMHKLYDPESMIHTTGICCQQKRQFAREIVSMTTWGEIWKVRIVWQKQHPPTISITHMLFGYFAEESVSSWESSDDGYVGNDEVHWEKLKKSNKENVYDGECFELRMTLAETVYSPTKMTKCRCWGKIWPMDW